MMMIQPHLASAQRPSADGTPLPRVRFDVAATLHVVDDGALLFDALAQRLYAANTTSTFIWFCLEDGASPDEAAARLSATFGIGRDDADVFVREALRQWTALGLVRSDGADRRRPAPGGKASDAWREPVAGPFRVHVAHAYRLLDTCFRVRFASATAERELHPFLESLADAPVVGEEPVIVDVRERGAERALCHAGRIVERWVSPAEIVPLAKIALVTLALERSDELGAFHAAAVARHPRAPCVLIAGPSGSGKSTLTAALAAKGYVALGDDTIALSRDGCAARPVPFGICVKDGAWDLLAQRVPSLAAQPVHRRLDGKTVRYIPGCRFERDARHSIKAIVFPRRRAGVDPCLAPVPRADALRALLTEFCPLGAALTAGTVEALVRWVCSIDCYEMRFSTLDDGVRLMQEICT